MYKMCIRGFAEKKCVYAVLCIRGLKNVIYTLLRSQKSVWQLPKSVWKVSDYLKLQFGSQKQPAMDFLISWSREELEF